MQKSVKVLLTAVIAVSMCAAMAGCGESGKKTDENEKNSRTGLKTEPGWGIMMQTGRTTPKFRLERTES